MRYFSSNIVLKLLFIIELDEGFLMPCDQETEQDQHLQLPKFATKTTSFADKQSSVTRINSTDSSMSFTKIAHTLSLNNPEMGQTSTFSSQLDALDGSISTRQSRINTITSEHALTGDHNDTVAEMSETSCSVDDNTENLSGLCLLFLTCDGSLWSVPNIDKQFLKLGKIKLRILIDLYYSAFI